MSSAPDAQTVVAELEEANRLLVQQVFKPIANEYRISVPAPGASEEGQPLLYVKQKKMKIKEDIRFRLSPDDEQHLFMIKSKSVFEFRGRHEVLDADGAVIGMLEKDFRRSLLRSHWHVRDAAGVELLEAHEASWIVALLRRFADLGPDLFSLLEWLPFNFVLRRDGQQVGAYKRVLGKFRDRYLLELGPELGRRRPATDRRIRDRSGRAPRPLVTAASGDGFAHVVRSRRHHRRMMDADGSLARMPARRCGSPRPDRT